jgi:WD40 repeat protein
MSLHRAITVHGWGSGIRIDEEDRLAAPELIPGAVQLSWGNAHSNPKELSFQIHGRLVARRSENATVERYVASIEHHAKRPWLCSIDSFLGQEGGHLVTLPSVSYQVYCVIPLLGSGRVVAASARASVVVINTKARGLVREIQGHDGVVRSLATTTDGSRIGDDWTVRVWDAGKRGRSGKPLSSFQTAQTSNSCFFD